MVTFIFIYSLRLSRASGIRTFRAVLFHLVLGWTVFGWIAALIWAIVETPQEAAGAPPLPTPEEPRLARHESRSCPAGREENVNKSRSPADRELDEPVLQIKRAEPFGPARLSSIVPLSCNGQIVYQNNPQNMTPA
jgi:Superinfection immunity protein